MPKCFDTYDYDDPEWAIADGLFAIANEISLLHFNEATEAIATAIEGELSEAIRSISAMLDLLQMRINALAPKD